MRRLLMALLASVPAVVLVGVSTDAPVANALAVGFSDQLVANVSAPTAVEQLPHGTVVVLEQHTGRVRLIDVATGALHAGNALDLSVCSGSERGLLGFTHDPDFLVNNRVYTYYTRFQSSAPGGCVNRVSAFTMIGDVINPASEQILIDNISSINGNHNGGDIEIGNDGFLYVSVGDAGSDPRGDSGSAGSNNAAQDLSLLNGKILRVNRFTGFAAAGNPFSGAGTADCRTRGNTTATPTTTCREIFSYGLRNPYRFAFDPNTNDTRFFINDVGQHTQEEVDEGAIGANFGWPAREGNCPQGQVAPCDGPPFAVVDSITSYPRLNGQYITGGAFIPDGAWPAEYDGGYLFGDGGSGQMWLRESNGNVDYNNPFTSGIFVLADMGFVLEPDGWALYYTNVASGQVRKITYSTPAAAESGPLRYQPLPEPNRAFDSRALTPRTQIRGGTTRLIDLDAPAGATAALVNLTLRTPAGQSFATVWEPRTRRPASSNVNALHGETVANSSILPLDANGKMLLYVQATSHVIVDVQGFFVDAPSAVSEGRFVPLDPQRLVDTREAVAADNAYERTAIGAADTGLVIPVADRLGIPTIGVSAVALLATGIDQGRPDEGFATFSSTDTSRPDASNLNTNMGVDIRANLVVVPIGADGSIDVFLSNTDHLLIDVAGYFTDTTAPSATAGRFILTPPTREVDTRASFGFGTLAAGATATLDPSAVPATASAVAQNLTVARSLERTFITAYPSGARPDTSNLNAASADQVRAALSFTKLDGGSERIYADGATNLIVDALGYFE